VKKNSHRSPPSQAIARPAPSGGPLLFPKHWRAVVGQHAIAEALKTHPSWVEGLWLRQGWESSQDLKKLHAELKGRIAKIEVKPPAILEKLSNSQQGAALFLRESPILDWKRLAEQTQGRILLLDGIEDPHNLGAILRTAWLSQVSAVLLPQDRAARVTPTVHKVACGGVEHVPIEICANFANVLEELRKMGFWIFGLSATGPNTLFDLKIPEKVVWCVGAEDKGLRSTTERLCDELVRIPQADAAASYNASVAVGMALLETGRQQSAKG